MNLNHAEDLFTASINVINLDNLAIEKARKCFLEFQNEGVIKKKCCFEDDVWYTTNEYANIGLHFKFNRFSYGQYQDIFRLEFDDFILYVKAYLALFGAKMHWILCKHCCWICGTLLNMILRAYKQPIRV